MIKMNEIKIGSKLYRKTWDKIEEVEVKDILLEKYINGYKTIIKVLTKSKLIYTYYVSELGYKLLTELPKDSDD